MALGADAARVAPAGRRPDARRRRDRRRRRLGLGKLSQSLLYELQGNDPEVYVLASALLLIVAVGAGLLPAARAARIDPMAALREE